MLMVNTRERGIWDRMDWMLRIYYIRYIYIYMLAGTLATGGGWVVGWLGFSCASRFVLRARVYTKYIALAKLRCFVICVRMGCWWVSDGG